MDIDAVLRTAQKLNASTEALAALGASLHIRAEHLDAPTAVGDRLDAVLALLEVDLDALSDEECRIVLGGIRAFFSQAAALLDAPDRPVGWVTDDPSTLQSQGRASMSVAALLGRLSADMADLGERLDAPGSAILDVGAGTGWLSVAFARAYPAASVVGLDVAEAPLALARGNVVAEGLAERVDLRRGDATDLEDEAAFDLAWVPGPFLGREAVPRVLAAVHRALRPGGWVLFGRYAGPDDPLAAELLALRVVRSGGCPWSTAEVEDLLLAAGFAEVHSPERTWSAPMVFTVGRRA